jgi:hypothetical protein
MKKCNARLDFLREGSPRLLRSVARSTVALVLVLSFASGVSASVIFEQSPVDGNDAFSSTSAAQSADDFVLSANALVSGVVWWGAYSAAPTTLPLDEFRVGFSADNGTGLPAINPLAEFTQAPTRTTTSLTDISGAPVYRYELGLPGPLSLSGGTTFHLSVVNEFDIGDPNANWYWLLSDATGDNFYRAASGDTWDKDARGNLSFAINANVGIPVPLPGTLLLLLSGLAGLGLNGLLCGRAPRARELANDR